MAEYQELIKNFERIRDYIRQFFIYGYKVRSDYDQKSARTYDNERRRIENWLGGYIRSDYTPKGKQVSISVDSLQIASNPLYAAWKSKSFTDNDILLHFFLLDLMQEGESFTAASISDEISSRYGVVFDSQTVRLKLKEYEDSGILTSKKQGRQLLYQLIPDPFSAAKKDSTYAHFMDAVKFFQEAAPFGFIGSTLLDRELLSNDCFRFKHHFLVHTLEDGVLSHVLQAMKEHRRISFTNKSTRSGNVTRLDGLPLKIFVSTQTGRRYVCIYKESNRRFVNIRLDAMSDVRLLEPYPEYPRLRDLLARNLPHCWGVSFGGSSRMEEIHVKLQIDPQKDPHILERLRREGRGGELIQLDETVWLYSGTFFDTNEMLSWVKTFTGRILDIQGSNTWAVDKINHDLDELYEMYCKEEPYGTV